MFEIRIDEMVDKWAGSIEIGVTVTHSFRVLGKLLIYCGETIH